MGDKTQVVGLYFADDAVLRGIIHSPMKRAEVKKLVADEVSKELKALQGSRTVRHHDEDPPKAAQLSEVKKENWFKRNAYWVIPVISLVVGSGLVLKIADLAIDRQFDVRLKPLSDSVKEVQTHLNTMETQQKDWTDFLKLLLPGQIKRLSGVTGPEFQKELPGVKVAFEVAKDHSVIVPPEEVKLISTQLSKSPASGQLWKAASAVIAYASPQPTPNLRSCGQILPAAMTGNSQNGYFKPGFLGPTWSNCNLDLNAELTPIEQATLKDLAKAPFRSVTCVRCTVTYSGGKIPLLTGSLKTIHLIECSFGYTPTIAPSPSGERAVRSILAAADLKEVDIQS